MCSLFITLDYLLVVPINIRSPQNGNKNLPIENCVVLLVRGTVNLLSPTHHLTTVSTAISTAAKTALALSSATSFQFVSDNDEAYMDSGATHVILNEFAAFLSICKCIHRSVTIGDESVVPVLGQGTVVFSLNSKIILV